MYNHNHSKSLYIILGLYLIIDIVVLTLSMADLVVLITVNTIILPIFRVVTQILDILLMTFTFFCFRKEKKEGLIGSLIASVLVSFIVIFYYSINLITRIQPRIDFNNWIEFENSPFYLLPIFIVIFIIFNARTIWILLFLRKHPVWFLESKTFLKVSSSKLTFNVHAGSAILGSLKKLQKYYIALQSVNVFSNPVADFSPPGQQHGPEFLFGNLWSIFIWFYLCWAYLTLCIIEKDEEDHETRESLKSLWFKDNKGVKVISKGMIEFEEKCELGSGNTSQVFLGNLTICRIRNKKIPVAVKILRLNSIPKRVLQQELQNMTRVMEAGGHPNLIKFFGACFPSSRKILIVMELCENGSLKTFLPSYKGFYKVKDSEMKQQFLKWSKEVATGLHQLSTLKLIHGDLSARNILVAADLTAKISDFGMSRKLYNYECYTTINHTAFPWKSMAPEILDSLKFTLEGDIWSFGVLIWEIFSSGEDPWQELNWTSDFIDKLKNGLRLAKPENMDVKTYAVIKKCWSLEPKERPKVDEILKNL